MNLPVEPTEPRYVTCECLHCKGGIEFDANQLPPNEKCVIACPHCQQQTPLAVPEPAFAEPKVTPRFLAKEPVKEIPAEISAPKISPPKTESAATPHAKAAAKPVIEQPPDTHEPARLNEWRVELPPDGGNGQVAYYEGARAVKFFSEFGGGVVLGVIHIGSAAEWDKLYPWALSRRMKILKRVIQEVIRQKDFFKCKTDIDEKSGHIFFRDPEAAKPVATTAPPIPPAPPAAAPSAPPVRVDDAQWQQQMGVALFREKDFVAAVKCFLRAAELGEPEAQCYLGFCFMYGQGVDKDEARSVEWFSQAAAQGNVGAEYCLGAAFYLGRGVPKDFATAVKWWRKAGEHGSADAQFNLAGCFEKGEGVMRNFVEAYKWAQRAAAQGNLAAQKKGEELLGKMNPEQIKMVNALGATPASAPR